MKPTLEQIKTDESVWPEGATHYTTSNDAMWPWLNENNNSFFRGDEWIEYPSLIEIKDHLIDAIPRPTKAFVPEVGGDSLLPEVGSIVGIYLASLGDILIPHVVKGYKVWRSINNDSDHHRVFILLGPSDDKRSGNNERLLNDIRPIKSERDKFIEAAKSVWNGTYVSESILGELYDAGCRFKEPTK